MGDGACEVITGAAATAIGDELEDVDPMVLSGVFDEVDSSVLLLVVDVVLVSTEVELLVENAVTVMRDRGTAVHRFPLLSVVTENPTGGFPLVDITKYESACRSSERNAISLVARKYIVRLLGHQNMNSIMSLTVGGRNRAS